MLNQGGGFGSQQSTSQAGASTSTTNQQGGMCSYSFSWKLWILRHRLFSVDSDAILKANTNKFQKKQSLHENALFF